MAVAAEDIKLAPIEQRMRSGKIRLSPAEWAVLEDLSRSGDNQVLDRITAVTNHIDTRGDRSEVQRIHDFLEALVIRSSSFQPQERWLLREHADLY